MLKKSFTLASAISLTGAVAWMSSTVACGGDEATVDGSSSSSGGDGGSSSGASSSGASSSGASSSSGDPFADAGLTDPKTVQGVDVMYGTCDPFTKCDGPIEGSWAVSGGCLDKSTFDQFRAMAKCPGIHEHDVVIKASGTVTATKTEVTQKTSIFLSAQIDIPKDCQTVQFVLLQSGGDCSGLNDLLTSGQGPAQFNHAKCIDDGANCKCAADATITEPGTAADPYDTDGAGTLTTQPASGPERTYDYCPKDDLITYRETTKDNKSFNMFLKIKKQ